MVSLDDSDRNGNWEHLDGGNRQLCVDGGEMIAILL